MAFGYETVMLEALVFPLRGTAIKIAEFVVTTTLYRLFLNCQFRICVQFEHSTRYYPLLNCYSAGLSAL
jgi:hypothetical protein